MQGKALALLLFVLYGSAFLAGFNENLMNMALVSIMSEYGIGSVAAQWTVTGYMIVATIAVMIMAYLYRRFELRTLYFAAAGTSFIGSLLGLLAPNFEVLMVARLIQAIGTGIFIPLMMNTIMIVVPKNKLGTYLSIGGCMITFGPALAPVVCGAFVTAFGWHSVFWVPVVATAVLAVLAFFAVKNFGHSPAQLDIPSVAMACVALTALSYGLTQITSNTLVGTLCLAVFLGVGAAFIWRQLHCAHPLIDLGPMKSIAFWPSPLLTTVAMMGTFSCSVLLPLYFEGATGLSAFVAGLVLLVPVLGNAGCTLVGGRIMDSKGEWPLLPAGYAAVTVGFVLMAAMAASLSLPAMFVATLLVYVGTGFVFSPSQTAGLRTLTPEQNPHGVAISTTCVQIAACIGPSLYTGILSSIEAGAIANGTNAALACAQGFGTACIVAAVVAGVGAVVAFLYSRAAVARGKAKQQEQMSVPAEQQPLAGLAETEPYTLRENASVREAMKLFVEREIGGTVLVDEAGAAVGFVSDGDIMRFLANAHPLVTTAYSLVEAANNQSFDERLHELVNLPVKDIATDKAITLDASASLEEACNLLATRRLKKLPLVRDGKVVGTLNRSDILRYAMSRSLQQL